MDVQTTLDVQCGCVSCTNYPLDLILIICDAVSLKENISSLRKGLGRMDDSYLEFGSSDNAAYSRITCFPMLLPHLLFFK